MKEKTSAGHLGEALGEVALAALLIWAATETSGILAFLLWAVAFFRVLSAGICLQRAERS